MKIILPLAFVFLLAFFGCKKEAQNDKTPALVPDKITPTTQGKDSMGFKYLG